MTWGIILLLFSVVAFSVLLMIALQRAILKLNYTINEPNDRGVKRYIFKGKRCILYNSADENKSIIKQYLLMDDENCKVLRCKMARPVSYIDYDVMVFDKCGEVMKIVNVKENLVNSEYTRKVELPKQTAYVRIILKEANDTIYKGKPIAFVHKKRITLYALASAVLTAFEVFFVKICCSYAFGGVFRESFMMSMDGHILTLIISLLLSAEST